MALSFVKYHRDHSISAHRSPGPKALESLFRAGLSRVVVYRINTDRVSCEAGLRAWARKPRVQLLRDEHCVFEEISIDATHWYGRI
jgi:hypothetical protein